MEWRVIGLNFLYAGLGVVLMFGAYRLIDILTPSVDFEAELPRHPTGKLYKRLLRDRYWPARPTPRRSRAD